MLNDQGLDAYKSVEIDAKAASTSQAYQLIIMLIDGFLEELERAKGLLTEAKKYDGDTSVEGIRAMQDLVGLKGASIKKLMDILIGLDSTLDHQNGGELAQNIHQLYNWAITELYEASRQMDNTRLDRVGEVIGLLREGWEGFEANQAAGVSNES